MHHCEKERITVFIQCVVSLTDVFTVITQCSCGEEHCMTTLKTAVRETVQCLATGEQAEIPAGVHVYSECFCNLTVCFGKTKGLNQQMSTIM